MSWALSNITTTDAYSPAGTLDGLEGQVRNVNLDVANASIYWQLKLIPMAGVLAGTWGQETFMTPGSRSLSRSGIAGVRVRSATAGKPAQVTVEAAA